MAGSRPVVVLVGTQMAENLGAVCRTMRCSGFEELRLVQPRCAPDAPGCRAMAAGAYELAAGAPQFGTLDEALDGLRLAIGFTRRAGRWRQLNGTVEEALRQVKGAGSIDAHEIAFVFGPEATGLLNDAIQRCDMLAMIPTDADHGSLNLAHAVTCACYEATRQALGAPVPPLPSPHEHMPLAEAQQRAQEALLSYLDELDFYTVPSRDVTAARFAQMLRRSLLTPRDLRFLEKILQKLLRLQSPP